MVSMITFGLCTLFLIATVTAIRLRGAFIRSADIHNNQNIPIRCTITWKGVDGPMANKDVITIDAKHSKTVFEKRVDMGSFTIIASIETLECGNHVLRAPFTGASGIQYLWQFNIEKTHILSAGPNPRE